MKRTLARRLLALLALIAPMQIARAQAETYSLTESGQWQAEQQERDADQQVIDQARRALAEDNPSKARTLLTAWLDDPANSRNIWRPAALRLRGDARVALHREYLALYDYEEVIRAFPESDEFLTAVERELDIAIRYANGLKRRAWGIRIFDATDVAVELLIRVQERTPGSALAERAAIELADFYYRTGDIALASEAYDLYMENFPKGPNYLKARQRRIFADIARFKGPKYDASGLIDAQIQIKELNRDAPIQAEQAGLSGGVELRIEESLAAKQLENARWYLARNEWPSARLVLRRLNREFPSTVAASRARDIMREKGWLESAATAPQAEPPQSDDQPTVIAEPTE
ncbi:MAG: outer membrane protein assembly factor BamD [Phycisphaerales bacterium]